MLDRRPGGEQHDPARTPFGLVREPGQRGRESSSRLRRAPHAAQMRLEKVEDSAIALAEIAGFGGEK